jgi:hypothetical protein
MVQEFLNHLYKGRTVSADELVRVLNSDHVMGVPLCIEVSKITLNGSDKDKYEVSDLVKDAHSNGKKKREDILANAHCNKMNALATFSDLGGSGTVGDLLEKYGGEAPDWKDPIQRLRESGWLKSTKNRVGNFKVYRVTKQGREQLSS